MRNLIKTLVLILPVLVYGQTTTENYIKTTAYQVPIGVNEQSTASDDDKLESVAYMDGLGRLKQTVAYRAGDQREDLITPVYYDGLGRQPKEYLPLPVPDNMGFYYDPQVGSVDSELKIYYRGKFPKDFYQGLSLYPDGWDNPYSNRRFEASPLNRVLEQGAPGFDWRIESSDTDHTIKYSYKANGASDVRYFSVDYNGNDPTPLLSYNGHYGARRLYKTITKDENWQPSDGTHGLLEEYTDINGRVILKRNKVYDPDPTRTTDEYYAVDTYYIYDDFGNLIFVLSPEGSDAIIENNQLASNYQTILDKFCYQYRYDDRNRLVEKQLPGKKVEYIVYDVLDRPILTQDANLRVDGKWLFTKYDNYNRVIMTGIYTPTKGMSLAQIEQDSRVPQYFSETRRTPAIEIGDTQVYYTNYAYPTLDIEVLTVQYYDDYIDTNGLSVPGSVFGVSTESAKGLPTVSKVRILGTSDWTTSFVGYDAKKRPIFTRTTNEYLSTGDLVRSRLDFLGNPIEVLTTHIKTGQPIVNTYDYYYYDHASRLISHKQKINNKPIQLITKNTYDELGQLVVKAVGGASHRDGYYDVTYMDASYDGTLTNTYPNGWTEPWPSVAKTHGEIPSGIDGGVQFTVEQDNKHVIGGLIKKSNSAQENLYFDYGIHLHVGANADKKVKLRINGSAYPNGNHSYGSFNTGDRFKVERVGSQVRFYHNNSLIETITSNVYTGSIIGKAIFTGPAGGRISKFSITGAAITQRLQHVNYKYNVRGWLTDINNVGNAADGLRDLGLENDLFKFRINYNRVEANDDGTPLYNGNIAQTLWKSIHDNSDIRAYNYGYDDLNRIKEAISYQGTNILSMSKTNDHDLSNLLYDRNGNILTLTREGFNNDATNVDTWDDLTYQYDGNRLLKVDDTAVSPLIDYGFKDGNTGNTDDFLYDDNGNMTMDRNKGITAINYNHLNLPKTVAINNGTENGTINYVYDATGVKLKKEVISGLTSNVTLYAGNYNYQGNTSQAAQLQFIAHPEGYIAPLIGDASGFKKGDDPGPGGSTYAIFNYVFQFKDHLGNVRISYEDQDKNGNIDPATEVIEESNYYPFGLKQKGYNNNIIGGNNLAQKWKFGGKEQNDELGLDWYDFGVRNYDAGIGRWMNIDPLAESFLNESTYNYSKNNPIFFVDPDGARVRFSDIYKSQNHLQTALNVLLDLSEQTGLTLTLDSDGVLDYKKGDNDEAVVEEREGVQLGSETARTDVKNAIDHDDTVSVYNNPGKGSEVPKGTNTIRLDAIQINFQIANTDKGLNNQTMGFGLTFLHEFYHTIVGGSLADTDGWDKGPTVERVNKVREELDKNPLNNLLGPGSQFGIRNRYGAMEVSRTGYDSKNDLVILSSSFTILSAQATPVYKYILSKSLRPAKATKPKE